MLRWATFTFHPQRLFLSAENPLHAAIGGSRINGATRDTDEIGIDQRWYPMGSAEPPGRGFIDHGRDNRVSCVRGVFRARFGNLVDPEQPLPPLPAIIAAGVFSEFDNIDRSFLIEPRDWVSLTFFLYSSSDVGCGLRELRGFVRFNVY